jgi:hypothetical protein
MIKKRVKSLKYRMKSLLSKKNIATVVRAIAAAAAARTIKSYMDNKNNNPAGENKRPLPAAQAARQKNIAHKTFKRRAVKHGTLTRVKTHLQRNYESRRKASGGVFDGEVKNSAAENKPAQNAAAAPRDKQQPHNTQRRHKQGAGHKLASAAADLVGDSVITLVLWLLFSLGVFGACAYFMFIFAVSGRDFPLWYVVFLGFFIFTINAFFAVFYGILMACLCIIKKFSQSVGGLAREAVTRVKSSIESKVNNAADAVSSGQIMHIVKQSFEDLILNVRQYAARTAAGIIGISVLTGIIFIAKRIAVRSAAKINNKAEFFTFMSAKASLILALLLNLNLFARIGLWIGGVAGLTVVLAQILIIFLIK